MKHIKSFNIFETITSWFKPETEMINELKANEKDQHGNNALISVSMVGYVNLISKMIKKGCNVNDTNNNGETALIWASFKNHKETVIELIKYNANVSIKNKNGLNAISVNKKLWADQDILDAVEKYSPNQLPFVKQELTDKIKIGH